MIEDWRLQSTHTNILDKHKRTKAQKHKHYTIQYIQYFSRNQDIKFYFEYPLDQGLFRCHDNAVG